MESAENVPSCIETGFDHAVQAFLPEFQPSFKTFLDGLPSEREVPRA